LETKKHKSSVEAAMTSSRVTRLLIQMSLYS